VRYSPSAFFNKEISAVSGDFRLEKWWGMGSYSPSAFFNKEIPAVPGGFRLEKWWGMGSYSPSKVRARK
jgi:hypothetical protein